MPRSNARPSAEFTERLAKAYEEIRTAFEKSLNETGCKQTRAARGMGIHKGTATNYVKGHTHVNVARVLAYPTLRKAFKRALCGDHDGEQVGYVARKRPVRK